MFILSNYKLVGIAICTVVLAMASVASAQSVVYGNVDPFDRKTIHSPNFVIGIAVEIPVAIQLESFGMYYGDDEFDPPPVANAYFGLYSSDSNGDPESLVVSTDSINLSEQIAYDNILFTSNPAIPAGTYWMMGLYDVQATPRVSRDNPNVVARYFPSPYANGLPATVTGDKIFTGQDFNYWIRGTVASTTVVVSPVGYDVVHGNYASGGVAELMSSDNADLSARRSQQDVQSRVTVAIDAVSTTANPSSLAFSVESSVFARTAVNQNVELFNFETLSWELLDTRVAMRITDQTVEVTPTGDLSRFVAAGSLAMQARIRFVSLVPRQAFAANIDHVFWTVGQ